MMHETLEHFIALATSPQYALHDNYLLCDNYVVDSHIYICIHNRTAYVSFDNWKTRQSLVKYRL